ncbi:endonuclease exonuclease phosphatase family domain containing protein [Babesia ovis]|uniref:Endonuclease exonuclease phosphatase family domain containing protein n=1 Tax=Babesia ovis TaxID=5869 RepID=A0A9W5TCP7_BABOV|nr:endonuclease exonuclease phosphatase family domain containing protein [Babesia ovis]
MIPESAVPLCSLITTKLSRRNWGASKIVGAHHSYHIGAKGTCGELRYLSAQRRYPRTAVQSPFKRDWIAIKNRIPVGYMATRDIPPAAVGAVRLGSDSKELGTIPNSRMSCGLGLDESALRSARDKLEDNRPLSGRSLSGTSLGVPPVTTMDRLAKEMGDITIRPTNTPKIGTAADKKGLIHRQWTSEKAKPVENARFTFEPLVVMSFNCLARSLVDNKYVNNDSDVMSWNSRKFAILDVLRNSNADVVCLQEVDEEEYNNFFLQEFEKLGYGSYFKKKKSPKLDGVCVLYKMDRFELLCNKDVEFSVHDANFDRLQVAVVLALIDKHTKAVDSEKSEVRDMYIVSNTHLLFNKNRGDVKVAQLLSLLSAIKEVEELCLENLGDAAKDNPKPAIIMCGDFNFTPQSLMYHFLSHGYAVLRNCNVKLVSGQYLMFDTTYKTEEAVHSKSGITVGDFEDNYMSEIYGAEGSSEWVESLRNNTCMDYFTKMPEWMKNDPDRRKLISNYLQAVSKQDVGHDRNGDSSNETDLGSARDLGSNAGDLVFCPYNFTSAYSVFDPGHNRCNEPAFTAFHGWQRGCVDYIWYTSGQLDVQSLYELPAYNDVTENGNLPNKGWPSSDHFSLVSQFKRHS